MNLLQGQPGGTVVGNTAGAVIIAVAMLFVLIFATWNKKK